MDVEPTVDKSFDFNSSSKAKEELDVPTTNNKRPIPLQKTIGKHLELHKVDYIIGLCIFLGTFFLIDAKIQIAVLNEKNENQKTQIESLVNKADSNSTSIQQQFSAIQEQQNDQDLIINEIKTKNDIFDQLINQLQNEYLDLIRK